jgi:hypothetical protein
MLSLEFPVADEIKRHPEVETLLLIGDYRTEILKDVRPISYAAISNRQCSLMITNDYGVSTLYYRSAGMLESAP